MERIRAFFSKVTDKHYRIERFGGIFCSLAVAMVCVVGLCAFAHSEVDQGTLSGDASLTDTFTTSRTGISGEVVRTYASDDDTRGFCLIKFSNLSKVPLDAEMWDGFITYDTETGGNPQGLRGMPSGSVYFFGNTGYAGLYFVNEEGFDAQVLKVTLRCTKELSQVDEDALSAAVDEDELEDAYSQVDMADLLLNFGAESAEPLPCLNGEGAPTIRDLYLQSVTVYDEAEQRQVLDGLLEDMALDISLVGECEERLATDGVIVPARPEYLVNDSVEADERGDLWANFANRVPGGYDFDWRDGSISEGYLKGLMLQAGLSRLTPEAFFSAMDETEGVGSDAAGKVDWSLEDGTALEDLNTGSRLTSRYTRLVGECDALTEAWADYYEDKEAYQTEGLEDLLIMEAELDDVVSSVTSNTDCFQSYEG